MARVLSSYTGSMTEKSESKERLARPLIRLAKLVGVGTDYVGQSDDYHQIDDDVLVAILKSLGIDASSDEAIDKAIHGILDRRHARLVQSTILHVLGQESQVTVNTGILEIPTASITLESGADYAGAVVAGPGDGSQAYSLGDRFVSTATVTIPADLPMGYHTLHVTVGDRTQDATLISAPDHIELPDSLRRGRLWGWMAQLYSIRSGGSWGVGDYEDLKTMLTSAKARTQADFILINPLHASEPTVPLTPSPYLPISRRFVNFTYIRPESIPEYAMLDADSRRQIVELHDQVEPLNGDAQLIDRDAMWRTKMRALWLIFKSGRPAQRQREFDAFRGECGSELESYATWCLCYDKWGKPEDGPDSWEKRFDRESPEVTALREQFPDTLDFYRWLEWIATQQLEDAQKAAKEAGMRLGIMSDMAVGVHPAGSDVWWYPERFAKGATVGAPPDYFNQQGQDWSQPPLSPMELENTGYVVYRDMVHGMFAKAGAVRIDHILGLFRLWWIPEGCSAKQGAYVYYDSEVMLGILAIEATRANGVVVGEDLGVVPDYVTESLSRHGVFGCSVEWFEQDSGGFRKPSTWRENALASVNTHDLPPAAGYLNYEQVKIRQRLNLLTTSVEEFKADAVREHDGMIAMLVDNGFLDRELSQDEAAHEQEIVEAQYRALTSAPSKLLAAAVVDGVGERRAQNQPGTNNEYPNWRVPLADGNGDVVPLEELFVNPRMQSLADVMNG